MSNANFETEENKKQINNICRSIVQQFKEGDYQRVAETLNSALELYPDNEKLQGLLHQFKSKYRDNRIKKLEDEAILLIQKGAGDEGQKRLREILELDPSRTDLQGSLKNLSAESNEEYDSNMQKDAVRKIYIYVAFAFVFVITTCISVAAWDNRKKLKNAKEHIGRNEYESAILELDKCGWFMAGGKSDIYARLLSIKDNLKEQADYCAGEKEYTKAIQLLQKASKSSISQDEFAEDIELFRKLQKVELKAKLGECAEKREYAKAIQLLQTASQASISPDEFKKDIELFQKLQKAELKAKADAQQAKRDCEIAARKAGQFDTEIETSQLMSEAKALSDEATTFLAANDFVQSQQRWNQAAQKYNEVPTVSIKIDKEHKDALLAKEQCQSIHDVAQKANAEIEATQIWEEATKTLGLADQQFEERQFIQARQSWLDAATIYTEALKMSRRSPSYLKAQQELKKWKGLKNAMPKSSVINLLGAPNYSLMESQRCILFYQDVPRVVSDSNGNISVINPTCGVIHFTNAGRDIALEYEKKKYDKAIMVQNRRYDADIKRADVYNDRTGYQSQLKESHASKIREIDEDHMTRRNNLTQGITPVKPIYFVSQWAYPDPDDVVSTLVSPQKQGESEVKWKIQSNWARLIINMEQRNVLLVLGSSVSANALGNEVFKFGNIQGFGELKFTRYSDNQLRLTYWKEPLWTAVSSRAELPLR